MLAKAKQTKGLLSWTKMGRNKFLKIVMGALLKEGMGVRRKHWRK
jgi:hypothetical protein